MHMTPKTLSLIHLVREPRQLPGEGEQAPLLVLLHGVGSNEYDLFGLADYLDPRFRILSVRSPLSLGAGAYGWYPVTFTPQGAVGDTRAVEAGRQKLIAFLEEAIRAYDVDPARVYLLGFSQGAIMSLFVGLTRPDLVTGLVVMSGRLLPEAWENRAEDASLSKLSVIAVHGTMDPILPIKDGRNIQAKLSTLPIDFTYREYAMGHHTTTESMTDIAQWLHRKLG
jgi:phospholipase/carboxylesterase